ncbi:MAG: PIN domain-containing protein [Cyclobacterium sp.]|uniref:type II toxin-antitoxin system VapC family toxin n=1 Tax=Cyclobacterium sp. TaxID=1966343 RepID=UPI003970A156
MTNLFIDTNIVLDVLAKRHPYYYSAAKLLTLADRKLCVLSVTSLTLANTHYVLAKLKSANQSKEVLRKLRLMLQVLSLDAKVVDLALNDEDFNDFEDGLQYYAALENRQDVILTRDINGFKSSRIPVMTPQEFLASLP